MIASMASVVMDAVRDKLLFGSEGLPLGLVTAKFRFFDVTYILSHDFRAGCGGFKRKRTRWSFGALIVASALVAVFAGPASALLLIPVYHTAWPAGGASFWLNGDLAPSVLEVPPSQDGRCIEYAQNQTLFKSTDPTLASCIWAGAPYLAEAFKERSWSNYRTMSYSDGSFRRTISFNWGWGQQADVVRVSAVGSNLAIGAYSRYIGQEVWCNALFTAPETQPGQLLANLRYRAYNGTRGNVRSPLPVVRTQCMPVASYLPTDGSLGTLEDGATWLPVGSLAFGFRVADRANSSQSYQISVGGETCDTMYLSASCKPKVSQLNGSTYLRRRRRRAMVGRWSSTLVLSSSFKILLLPTSTRPLLARSRLIG